MTFTPVAQPVGKSWPISSFVFGCIWGARILSRNVPFFWWVDYYCIMLIMLNGDTEWLDTLQEWDLERTATVDSSEIGSSWDPWDLGLFHAVPNSIVSDVQPWASFQL